MPLFGRFPRTHQKPQLLLTPDQRQSTSNTLGFIPVVDVGLAHHSPRLHRLGDALEVMLAQVLAGERPADKLAREPADHHLVRPGQRLQAGGAVWGIAHHARLFRCAFADDVADHDQAGVDADAHRQIHVAHRRVCHADVSQGLHDAEAGARGALGVVLVCLRITKIHQHAVAHVPSNEAAETGHHLAAALLVSADHLAHVLRIEPRRQRGRTDQVAKHHCQLATLGLGGSEFGFLARRWDWPGGRFVGG